MANKKNRPCKKCGELTWDTPIKTSSRLCKRCWSLERRHTTETKQKIKDSQSKTWSDPLYRARMSAIHRQRLSIPENHPNWQGGKTFGNRLERNSRKYKDFRIKIFIRDNYTCLICDKRGGEIQIDHIKQWAYFPELRYDENNVRTLCIDCHKATPTYKRKVKING